MMQKSKTTNIQEEARQKDLESYGILDTAKDTSFDKITRLASAICGAPMAAVTFIDYDRQWVKSSVGLGDVTETTRNDSFCTYTIEDESILEVQDTLKDQRFKNHPAVTGDPGIRFYAGAPLISPRGNKLGALCVVGKEPKSLTPDQLDAMKILASQVLELMELRKVNREMHEAKMLLEDQQQLMINKARLQTIGELAGGVCHQINNPLAIIVGRSMILRSRINQMLPNSPELMSELDVIDQTSQRVSGILKALRMYAKDMGQEVIESDVTEIIDDALTLIRPKFKLNEINLKYETKSHAKVKINKNQISQVVMDLLSNAVEAMEDSTVKEIEIAVKDSSKNVIISISDSGKGIRQEDHGKIFEPFFTTKSRHFGVGLSNAMNFMNQNKGEIVLMSGRNPTTFRIMIPKTA